MERPDSLERLRAACAKPLAHPGPEELDEATRQIAAFALADYAELPRRPIGPASRPPDTFLCAPPPEHPTPLGQVFADFHAAFGPAVLRPAHPRFLAFVPGAPSFPSVLGDWLCSALNLSVGTAKDAASATQVERLVLDWFRQIVGYPPEASGILTSGGSEAILTAIVTAREPLPFEFRTRAVLYASEQRHWSVDRGARIAGFRPDQFRILPVDADQRLAVDCLARAVADDAGAGRVPWLVIANAGTTNTGAIDPLAALADWCASRHLWLHVDGAYGWAAALTSDGRQRLHGIDRADSISLDPHKWFAQTYDVGCLLVRRGPALAEAFATRPEYLQDVVPNEGEVNFADHGIALTRRFRALKIWFSVRVLGLTWFRQLVAHGCNLAALAQALLEEAGNFQIVSPRQLSVLCFRLVPAGWSDSELDGLNRALCSAVSTTGQAYLATTRVHDVVALRLCFVNWRTTTADVEAVVGLLTATGQRLLAECLPASGAAPARKGAKRTDN